MATEARTKIDALAVSQVQAQNDFTAAVKAQTDALKSFGTSIDDVRKTGRWLVILIVVMSIATVASIFMR